MKHISSKLSVFILLLIAITGCNSRKDPASVAGKWKVLKAEVDGYEVTDRYGGRAKGWIYLGKGGSLLSGHTFTTHSGKWKFDPINFRLNINSSSPQWRNTTWKAELIDSVMFLKGTKQSNNFTSKIWMVQTDDSYVPPYKKYSNHVKKFTGTWNLVRVKKNAALVGTDQGMNEEKRPEITFHSSGIYESRFQNEEESGQGVWDIDEKNLTLSFFPFEFNANKEWQYSFVGDFLMLNQTEGSNSGKINWEWVWNKARDLKGTSIRYIANEGCLIERNGKKVLIDALHKFYSPDYLFPPGILLEKMISGRTPFDDISYLLVSHIHGDHFHPEAIRDFLANHPETELIAGNQVLERMEAFDEISEQIISADLQSATTFSKEKSGIRISAFELPHNEPHKKTIQNLGHIIEIDGIRILHTGDAELSEEVFDHLDLSNRSLDVAIIPYWYLWDADESKKVKEWINPGIVIATHIPPEDNEDAIRRVTKQLPGAIIFVNEGDKFRK